MNDDSSVRLGAGVPVSALTTQGRRSLLMRDGSNCEDQVRDGPASGENGSKGDDLLTGFGVRRVPVGAGVSVSALTAPTQFGAPWDFTPATNDPEKVRLNTNDPERVRVNCFELL